MDLTEATVTSSPCKIINETSSFGRRHNYKNFGQSRQEMDRELEVYVRHMKAYDIDHDQDIHSVTPNATFKIVTLRLHVMPRLAADWLHIHNLGSELVYISVRMQDRKFQLGSIATHAHGHCMIYYKTNRRAT